jgi:hypothetical protein
VSPRRSSAWTVARTFAALLALATLAACGSLSGSGGAAVLTSVSGNVTGYPYTGVSTVQAFAPNDGAQLASGRLFPDPGARVEGTLTALDSIPASSFVNPYLCVGATVTPSSMMTTGVLVLGVADSGGTLGLLGRTTAPNLSVSPGVGDRMYGYLVSTHDGRISGSCAYSGVSFAYDIDLSSGWNHVSAHVDAVDSLGNIVAITFTDQAPGAGAAWRFADVSGLSSTAGAPPGSWLDAVQSGLLGR